MNDPLREALERIADAVDAACEPHVMDLAISHELQAARSNARKTLAASEPQYEAARSIREETEKRCGGRLSDTDRHAVESVLCEILTEWQRVDGEGGP
jgi:hypothetical protein